MHKNEKTTLLGFGTVGKGFYQYLKQYGKTDLLNPIIIKNESKKRDEAEVQFTTSYSSIEQNETKTVVELISHAEDAYHIIKKSLQKGKTVISANKKAIVYHLPELRELEKKHNARLLYEGAVCGSIPVLRIIQTFYRFDDIYEIRGIFNGTSNYILTQLTNKNISFESALKDAQGKGFAEVDPSSDVGGHDSLYKLLLLAAHIYGLHIHPDEALHIGIEHIGQKDIQLAKKAGLKIKLIARLRAENNTIRAYVIPTFVNKNDELYHVENEVNGIQIRSTQLQEQFYKGRGAGKFPIGHTVYSDFEAPADYRYTYGKDEFFTYDTKAEISVYTSNFLQLENLLKERIYIGENCGFGKLFIADLHRLKKQFPNNSLPIIEVDDTQKNELIKASRETSCVLQAV